MSRFLHRLHPYTFSAILLTILTLHASDAHSEESSFVDAFVGAGIAVDPGDDDITGNVIFGAGFRPISRLSVGLEGYRTKWSSGGWRLLLDGYGVLYPFPNKFVNPYGKAGLGFVNISTESNAYYPTDWRIIPVLGGGLELGWKYVSLFGELTWRFNSTRSNYTVSAISIGLSAHLYR